MTQRLNNTMITNREIALELVLTPFRAFASAIARMTENNSRTQALAEISAIPEAELRAKGMTRADAISMAFRHDA